MVVVVYGGAICGLGLVVIYGGGICGLGLVVVYGSGNVYGGVEDRRAGASPYDRASAAACWSSNPSRPGDAIAAAWSPASSYSSRPSVCLPPLHTPDRTTDGRLPLLLTRTLVSLCPEVICA
ncbi:hypothetical protein VPH35_077897 [Triticum aestivum]|uniref:Uncharacterized protein n=1 Tax=Aegilops tauschii TaxID=37682 RepID=M8CEH5_AEGTA